MTHDDSTTAAAATYFDAWLARDFARLGTVLADDVDFAGPMGQVKGRNECLRGLEGLATIMTGIDVQKVFSTESDVLTWYDMATTVADPVSTRADQGRRVTVVTSWRLVGPPLIGNRP